MRTTITLPSELVNELLDLTGAKNKTKAVLGAVEDEIMRKKREKVIDMAGKIRFMNGIEKNRANDRRLGRK
ncbi:MAG: DUF2191 domain-containing protein [Deltaproteobacteria bacterium]|nr:MAG: DUF2191 domain-containing protein [Deltaproteobacteria bacterium]